MGVQMVACAPLEGDGHPSEHVLALPAFDALTIEGPLDVTLHPDAGPAEARMRCDGNVLPFVDVRVRGNRAYASLPPHAVPSAPGGCQVGLQSAGPLVSVTLKAGGHLTADTLTAPSVVLGEESHINLSRWLPDGTGDLRVLAGSRAAIVDLVAGNLEALVTDDSVLHISLLDARSLRATVRSAQMTLGGQALRVDLEASQRSDVRADGLRSRRARYYAGQSAHVLLGRVRTLRALVEDHATLHLTHLPEHQTLTTRSQGTVLTGP